MDTYKVHENLPNNQQARKTRLKCAFSGEQWYYKGILHATTQAVISAGRFAYNHGWKSFNWTE